MGRLLLIRDRESVLWIKFGFRFLMVSFGGSEVERWWKLHDLSYRSFSVWLNFGVHDWEFNFDGCFSLGVSSDDGWCWIPFYSGRFREGVCFRWWRVFWWVLSTWVFLRCLFLGVPPIYDASCLYSQFHRSLFVLNKDLVV